MWLWLMYAKLMLPRCFTEIVNNFSQYSWQDRCSGSGCVTMSKYIVMISIMIFNPLHDMLQDLLTAGGQQLELQSLRLSLQMTTEDRAS